MKDCSHLWPPAKEFRVKYKRTIRNLSAMTEMALDLALGRYPSFVYNHELRQQEMPPVFCMHRAELSSFERILQYLSQNRYQPLNCDEYFAISRGEKPVPGRSLLLTFDDGHLSVWSIAYPLLKKYGYCAVVFLNPGRMEKDAGQKIRPTLEGVWSGRCSLEEVELANNRYDLITWSECREMYNSGSIDFQSHTHNHEAIFISEKIIGFVQPWMLSRFWPFQDRDLERNEDYNDGVNAGSKNTKKTPTIGMPIYASASRMSEFKAYRPAPTVATTCVNYVSENGGARFFSQSNWEKRLRKVAAQASAVAKANGEWGVRESEEERRAAIVNDLSAARQTIMEHFPGKEVKHLAYPWGTGSTYAVFASRQVGYLSNFWGKFQRRLYNYRGGDPLNWTRIGGDFICLLQGQGRMQLQNILWTKLRRWKSRNRTSSNP